MEGPTPVSALIHAATMVTAGVYMVARCAPLFAASPDAQLVVACIGGFTALLAALIALTQFDLKRILAYSTISQLGYMFLALGTGTVAGVTAGMFHLFTHAFFKALLFLGAGSVMHAMGNVIDIRRFGGLRQRMPWTHRTFLVGCLALAGIFPFAGFWSKDQVLASVHARAYPDATHAASDHAGSSAASITRLSSVEEAHAAHETDHARAEPVFVGLYWCAVFTAFLTAFYTFRAYFMTFFGPQKVPEEAGHHAHESPPVMWLPLVVLAIFAFGIGFVVESGHRFASYLGQTPSLAYLGEVHSEFHLKIALVSTLFAVLGVGLAAFFYLGHQREVDVIARCIRPLYQLSYHKFYLDEIYMGLVVWPLRGIAWCSDACDRWLIDGLVDLCGRIPLWIGRVLRQWQVGFVPFYSLMMVVGTVLILILGRILWGGG
jgi:NADH-quinone oxidoreductase subunit L